MRDNTKYLLLNLSSEHDWMVAVVPVEENFQTKMELRLRRVSHRGKVAGWKGDELPWTQT